MRAGMDLILRNGSFYRSILHLPKLHDIPTCMAFLTAVGITRDRLVIHVPRIRRSPKNRLRWLWGEYLSLDASQIYGKGAVETPGPDLSNAPSAMRPTAPQGASVGISLAAKIVMTNGKLSLTDCARGIFFTLADN